MNLDQALRDAAEPVPARVCEAPAQALLDRIVTSSPDPVPVRAEPARAARRPRKAVIAVLAAAVAATAALTLPNLGSDAAYASWTPQPSPLAAADRDELAERCIAQYRAAAGGNAIDYNEPNPAVRIVHGERRGDYAYISIVTPDWSVACFRDHDGNLRRAGELMGPVKAAALGGTGVEMHDWSQMRTEDGYCRLMTGHVGSEVVGVDITVRARSGDRSRTLRATVEGGYFLAWYPEQLDESNTNTTSLTLRLADGGTVEGLSARDLSEAPRVN
jgi:hypothetical protein